MAKYQFKVEVNPPTPEGASDADVSHPTIAQVADALEAGLEAAYPDAEVRVYDGERSDAD